MKKKSFLLFAVLSLFLLLEAKSYSNNIGVSDSLIVKVFFNNNRLDPEITCTKVFPVERTVKKTEAVARAALEELLKGPTEEEKAEDYYTNISSNVKIQKLTIEDGVARADFDQTLEYRVAGSCRVQAIALPPVGLPRG